MAKQTDDMIVVTQVKSGMHAKPKTCGTLRALGLGRIGKSNTLPDRPEIRGMIARVPHLCRPTGRPGRVLRGEDRWARGGSSRFEGRRKEGVD